jgi:hypothetical protein
LRKISLVPGETPAHERLLAQVSRIGGTAAFCERFTQLPCHPGGELDNAVNNYRAAFADSASARATINAAGQIVRALPSSGCPAPK